MEGLLPYLGTLLAHHEEAGQQPDNLCGPYWLALLLKAYAGVNVTAVEVAIATQTLLPATGDPADWLPAGAVSKQGGGYGRIPTSADLNICGTSVQGLVHGAMQLSEGRFELVPLAAEDWQGGLEAVLALCQTYPQWEMVPLLNLHTSYLRGSRIAPWQLVNYLAGKNPPLPPPDWSVGHFALLVGSLGRANPSLYAVLDTYPHFGWQGLHLQPPDALAQGLARPGHGSQGGIALWVASADKAQLTPLLAEAQLRMALWDNGTPFCPEGYSTAAEPPTH